MILVVDIGNTNVTLGVYDKDNLVFVSRLPSKRQTTADQCVLELLYILKIHDVPLGKVEDSIISSVVPSVTNVFSSAILQLLKKTPVMVNHKLNLNFEIHSVDPASIGADLIAGIAGGLKLHNSPIIVIDLGTATTFSVVDKENKFIGCVIAPGVKTSVDSLIQNAELLTNVSVSKPKKVLNNITQDCLRSGIIYGTAAMIDGVCDCIENELGYRCKIIATGGFCEKIIPSCKKEIEIKPYLLLSGLNEIYKINFHI